LFARLGYLSHPEERVDFGMDIPQRCQDGGCLDGVDPGTAIRYDQNIRFFMHDVTVDAIDVHERGVRTGGPYLLPHIHPGVFQGRKNPFPDGAKPLEFERPDKQCPLAEFGGELPRRFIQYTAAERVRFSLEFLENGGSPFLKIGHGYYSPRVRSPIRIP
jgi:hypothetical protein